MTKEAPNITAYNAILERERAQTRQPNHQLSAQYVQKTLRMMFLCCHPTLPVPSRLALTLKTLCGFGVPEIARDGVDLLVVFVVAGSRIAQVVPVDHELEMRAILGCDFGRKNARKSRVFCELPC